MVLDSFKRAIDTPIIKKQTLSKGDPKDYRPVSGHPFICKPVERVVAAQVTNHIDGHGTVSVSGWMIRRVLG